jgi:hypothetical protein
MSKYKTRRIKKRSQRTRKQHGGSQLHIAVEKGDLESVKRLIGEGVDVNSYRNNTTSLILASMNGNLEIVKLLLAVPGIDVNAKTTGLNEYTALMLAAGFSKIDIVRELVKAPGIDINAVSKYGKSAISLTDNEEIKNILKEYGAKPPAVKENEDNFLKSKTIPKDNYILFCSLGYRTIENGNLPKMPYLWAQLHSTEPTPANSWFCDSKNTNNAFYVYKIKKPLKLLIVSDYYDFGNMLISENPTLKDKIRFSQDKHPDDYVDIALQYKLFKVDGVYRDDTEIILFSPWSNKLEFVKRYGGETAKTSWSTDNAEKKGYFEPSYSLLEEIKHTLKHSPHYDKIKRVLK